MTLSGLRCEAASAAGRPVTSPSNRRSGKEKKKRIKKNNRKPAGSSRRRRGILILLLCRHLPLCSTLSWFRRFGRRGARGVHAGGAGTQTAQEEELSKICRAEHTGFVEDLGPFALHLAG